MVFKENLNASRPSEHAAVRGENVKAFRWDHRLQRQNLFVTSVQTILVRCKSTAATVPAPLPLLGYTVVQHDFEIGAEYLIRWAQ